MLFSLLHHNGLDVMKFFAGLIFLFPSTVLGFDAIISLDYEASVRSKVNQRLFDECDARGSGPNDDAGVTIFRNSCQVVTSSSFSIADGDQHDDWFNLGDLAVVSRDDASGVSTIDSLARTSTRTGFAGGVVPTIFMQAGFQIGGERLRRLGSGPTEAELQFSAVLDTSFIHPNNPGLLRVNARGFNFDENVAAEFSLYDDATNELLIGWDSSVDVPPPYPSHWVNVEIDYLERLGHPLRLEYSSSANYEGEYATYDGSRFDVSVSLLVPEPSSGILGAMTLLGLLVVRVRHRN